MQRSAAQSSVVGGLAKEAAVTCQLRGHAHTREDTATGHYATGPGDSSRQDTSFPDYAPNRMGRASGTCRASQAARTARSQRSTACRIILTRRKGVQVQDFLICIENSEGFN